MHGEAGHTHDVGLLYAFLCVGYTPLFIWSVRRRGWRHGGRLTGLNKNFLGLRAEGGLGMVTTGLCFVSYVSVGQLGKDSGLVEEVEELTMNINTNPSELRIPLTFPTAGLPSPQVVPSLSDFPFR